MMRALLTLRLMIVVGLFFSMSTAARAAEGDYNGDGRSDLSVVLVDRSANATYWLTRLGPEQFYFWAWEVAGDAFVTGKFFGNGINYPGVVRVVNLNTPLEWRIKSPFNTDIVFYYGLPGDGVPNQGDIDCDGVDDAIVTRNGSPSYWPGFKLWYAMPSSAPGTVYETLFGLKDDFAGLADMDGDGCKELVVLRDGFYWYTRDLFAQEGYTVAQWGLNGDLPLLPQDINGDGKADYIVTRRTGVLQLAYVRFGDGPNDWGAYWLGFDTSIPQVGNFIGTNFFAWSQRDVGWMAIGDPTKPGNIGELLPFGIPANHIVRADGTVVTANSDGRFPESSSEACSYTTDFIDGPGNALWKPVSERNGRPVFLLQSYYWTGPQGVRDIKVLGKDGTQVAIGTRRDCCEHNDGRAHFDVSKRAAELAPYGPITVKLFLNNGERECRIVENPERRYD